jgi:hypothetical protein
LVAFFQKAHTKLGAKNCYKNDDNIKTQLV